MPKLKDFEGEVITLILPNPNHPNGLHREKVKLLTVEDAGLWIENQTLTNEVLDAMKLPVTKQLAVFFYRDAAIHAIFVTIPRHVSVGHDACRFKLRPPMSLMAILRQLPLARGFAHSSQTRSDPCRRRSQDSLSTRDSYWVKRNTTSLTNVAEGVVTVTLPNDAPAGTDVVISPAERIVNVAGAT